MLAFTVRLHSRQSAAIAAKTQTQLRFIGNRARALAASCAPYSFPPISASRTAVPARPLLPRAWPLRPLWAHSSRWSCLSRRVKLADLQVWPVLGPSALTMAAGAAAGAIGFRQRTEDSNLGQTFDLAQQAAPLR